jgi:hypothetical protein
MLFEHENKLMFFKEFILTEAINPKETDFGTDGKNRKFLSSDKIVYTFFKDDKNSYLVAIDKVNGEVAFSSKEGEISLNSSDYDVSRKDTYNATKVFNKVFYIILIMIKKYDLDLISFDAANPALGNVYSVMVKNKKFQEELEKVGYKFYAEIGNSYYFEKI